MVAQKEGGLVSRAVREALCTLVSPHVCEQLVSRALSRAGAAEIPESGREIAAWIEGALRKELELSLGSDAAELVSSQLAPIAAHATSSSAPAREAMRGRFGSDDPTGVVAAPARAPAKRTDLASTARMVLSKEQLRELRRAPLEDEGYTARPPASELLSDDSTVPRVLTASSALAALEALQRSLGDSARVVHVPDLVGLLDALDEPGLSEPIVLLDCQRPTVHVTSIAAIVEDLPRGTTVVLWGASEETWRDLDRDRVPSCRWVRCSHEATTEDVGSLCAMLLG